MDFDDNRRHLFLDDVACKQPSAGAQVRDRSQGQQQHPVEHRQQPRWRDISSRGRMARTRAMSCSDILRSSAVMYGLPGP